MITYEMVSAKYSKNDIVNNLKDNKHVKISGFVTCLGDTYYDSFDYNIILWKDGVFADIIVKGVDKHRQHIENVIDTCKRLNCSSSELLHMDYIAELKTN